MKTITKQVYYCDFCKKYGLSKSNIKKMRSFVSQSNRDTKNKNVFIVKNDSDVYLSGIYLKKYKEDLIGEVVLIDGTQKKVIGIETFARAFISAHEQICLVVG